MAAKKKKGKGFLSKGAIKRPGRMKRLAARHGVSLGKEIEKDKSSSDPSLRAAANLGARFRKGGDLHKGPAKKTKSGGAKKRLENVKF